MFLVSETWEERKAKILSFAEQDCCVGVILATINVEWCLRRCILAMGSTSVSKLNKLNLSGLDKYKKCWKEEVQPNVNVSLAVLMDTHLTSAKSWKPTKTLKTCNGWPVLNYAFLLRHVLVHGAKGSASPEFAQQTIDLLLEAADVLVRFAESQGTSIFGKRICRRKCFIPKVVKA